jgi:hypothetical protein
MALLSTQSGDAAEVIHRAYGLIPGPDGLDCGTRLRGAQTEDKVTKAKFIEAYVKRSLVAGFDVSATPDGCIYAAYPDPENPSPASHPRNWHLPYLRCQHLPARGIR